MKRIPDRYDKRNDGDWCWGVMGTILGLLALSASVLIEDVVSIVRSQGLTLIGVGCLTSGLLCCRFSKAKQALFDTISMLDELLNDLTTLRKEFDKIEEGLSKTTAQQTSPGDSSPRDAGLGTPKK